VLLTGGRFRVHVRKLRHYHFAPFLRIFNSSAFRSFPFWWWGGWGGGVIGCWNRAYNQIYARLNSCLQGNTSDVLLWVSHDGIGEEWSPYSLSYRHNLGAAQWRGVVPFDWKVQ